MIFVHQGGEKTHEFLRLGGLSLVIDMAQAPHLSWRDRIAAVQALSEWIHAVGPARETIFRAGALDVVRHIMTEGAVTEDVRAIGLLARAASDLLLDFSHGTQEMQMEVIDACIDLLQRVRYVFHQKIR